MIETEKHIIREYMSHNNFYVTHNCVYCQKEAIDKLNKVFSQQINISRLYDVEILCIFTENKMMIVTDIDKYYFNIKKLFLYKPITFEREVVKISCEPVRDNHLHLDIFNYFNKYILKKYGEYY